MEVVLNGELNLTVFYSNPDSNNGNARLVPLCNSLPVLYQVYFNTSYLLNSIVCWGGGSVGKLYLGFLLITSTILLDVSHRVQYA